MIEDVPVQRITFQDKRPKSWEPLFRALHVGQSVFIPKMTRSGGANVAIQYQTCSEAVFGEKGKRRISYWKDKIAMAAIKIDKGIPFQPVKRGKRDSKYPWMEMEIGDSFLFPANLKKSTACNNASFASKRHGKKFVVRKTPEGYRCWRVK